MKVLNSILLVFCTIVCLFFLYSKYGGTEKGAVKFLNENEIWEESFRGTMYNGKNSNGDLVFEITTDILKDEFKNEPGYFSSGNGDSYGKIKLRVSVGFTGVSYYVKKTEIPWRLNKQLNYKYIEYINY